MTVPVRRCALALALLLSLAFTGEAAATKTVCAAGCDATTIQGAVDLAVPGEMVTVAAGTYEEQVDVAKEGLVLRGAGVGQTIVRSPVNPVSRFSTDTLAPDNAPVIWVHDVASASVESMTIDGAGRGGPTCTLNFHGLAFRRAGGTASSLSIVGFRHTPLDGCQVGNGVYVFNDDSSPPDRTLTLTDVAVSDFQKNGVSISSTDLAIALSNVDVSGAGAQPDIAQNGIVVSSSIVPQGSPGGTLPTGDRVTGTISGGEVKDHLCNQASCGPDPLTQSQSAGISLIDSNVDLAGNTIQNNDNGLRLRSAVLARAGTSSATGNTIAANRFAGVYATAGSATLTSNRIAGPGDAGVRAGAFLQGGQFLPALALVANDIAGAGDGLHLFRNNASSASPAVSAARNRVVGNAAGVNNTTPGSVSAENNWWGCNDGPGATGCDPTTGPVDSDPRLVLGVSASPSTIDTGGASSAIAASVRRNSAGDTQPSPFFAPLPTAFAATLGTIAPAAGTLTDGLAPATLTSGSQAGTSTVTATLDNQSATTGVAFVQPVPKQDPDPDPTPDPQPDPPVTPDPPRASLTISHRRVPYSGGRIKLRLICDGGAGARCRGKVSLTATSLGRRIRGAASTSARFDVPVGASQTVRVQPPKRLVQLVRQRRKAIGKAIARLDAIEGQTLAARTVKRLITVQARRARSR
jgi:hypothetical protein